MEIIVLLIAVVCVVWTTLYAKLSSLLTTNAILLIIGSCFGHAFFNMNVGPVPITLDRLLWCGLVAQFLYFHHAKLNDPKPIGRIDIAFALYIVYLGFNTLLTDWRQNGNAPMGHLLFFYVLPAGAYWVARQTKLSERDFRFFTLLMSGFGIYLAVTAFAETQGWWFMVFPNYIGSPEVTAEFFGRGRGPFLNPISCGLFQIFCFCCMLMWWPRVKMNGKILIVSLSIVFTVGIVCTMTRSIWLALLVSVGLLIWVNVTKRSRALLIAGGVVVGTIGLMFGGEYLGSFERDKDVTATQMAQSAALRPMLAAVAVDMAKDRPVFGCGLGQYTKNAVPYHYSDNWNMPIRTAKDYVQHNVFLASLVETGLVGMLLLITLLSTWGWQGWKLWRKANLPLWVRQFGLLQVAVILSFVVNGMFHDTSIIAMSTALVFFMSGVSTGLAAKHLQPKLNRKKISSKTALGSEPQSSLGIQA